MTRRLGFIFIFLAFALSFQNCSQTSTSVRFSTPSLTLNGSNAIEENGQGYDGKIFVLMGDVCPDGTRLRSRIVLKSSQQADLVRKDCEEVPPVPLGPEQFQWSPLNPRELIYQNQIFASQLIGTKFEMRLVQPEIGNCYLLPFDFGTPPDDTDFEFRSALQIYEDGKPLGPAHAPHSEIRNIGLGRFSHWESGTSVLRFSSSDNTNPLTNGRTYTWEVIR